MKLQGFLLFFLATVSNAFKVPSPSFFPFYHVNGEQIQDLKQHLGRETVLQVSSLLPKLDTVGHDILRANHDFIEDVLHNELLSHEMKKNAILGSIKLAQYGDDFGSHILQQYYNIVDACL
jgi:hypothetical protein|tara:strand:- start:567 stop:929 length:363 start_codon:yes stop_codon:yes gene_type:complete